MTHKLAYLHAEQMPQKAKANMSFCIGIQAYVEPHRFIL